VKYSLLALFMGSTAFAQGAATAPAPAVTPLSHASPPDTQIVRGLYVNRFAAQSTKRIHQLIAIADQTEINALIIDIKDEFGLNYAPTDPSLQRNAGKSGTIPHLKELLDTLRAHKILAVARIVVFKDSVTARVHPEWTIRKADGTPWRDKKGLAWVNPYHHELWDYRTSRFRRRSFRIRTDRTRSRRSPISYRSRISASRNSACARLLISSVS